MKDYERSICSTCRHMMNCSITRDKSMIVSCSEYAHFLDTNSDPILVISNEMASNNEFQRELVLN
jgi:hypothetical protein